MQAAQAESSLLLLTLASVVVALMSHVAFSSLRNLRLTPGTQGLRERWAGVVVVAVVLGTGLCASMVLALGAEGLNFPLGYATSRALLLWLGACALCLPAVALLVASPHPVWLWLVGAALGALAAGLQAGWIETAGFRPGVIWRTDFLVLSTLLQAAMVSAAAWLALSAFTAESERALTWRATAVLVVVLATTAGQEVLILGAGLATQVGSVYVRQLSGAWLCVLAGAVVPVVFGFQAVALALQTATHRRSSRHAANLPGGERRTRRRQRIRTL